MKPFQTTLAAVVAVSVLVASAAVADGPGPDQPDQEQDARPDQRHHAGDDVEHPGDGGFRRHGEIRLNLRGRKGFGATRVPHSFMACIHVLQGEPPTDKNGREQARVHRLVNNAAW